MQAIGQRRGPIPTRAFLQVIEDQFLVGAIGHVAGIGRALLLKIHVMQHAAHAEPQLTEDRCDFFCVTLGQIVIDRDHMNATADEGMNRDRQCRGQGLALASGHFREMPAGHDKARLKLVVVKGETAGAIERLVYRGHHIRQAARRQRPLPQSDAACLRLGPQSVRRQVAQAATRRTHTCHKPAARKV